jgi:hypothetical protein
MVFEHGPETVSWASSTLLDWWTFGPSTLAKIEMNQGPNMTCANLFHLGVHVTFAPLGNVGQLFELDPGEGVLI